MSAGSKKLAVAIGVTTIVGALTAYSTRKKWEEVHTIAVVIGAALTAIGSIS
jgi:Sec-independent protein secretion pathway component TatC